LHVRTPLRSRPCCPAVPHTRKSIAAATALRYGQMFARASDRMPDVLLDERTGLILVPGQRSCENCPVLVMFDSRASPLLPDDSGCRQGGEVLQRIERTHHERVPTRGVQRSMERAVGQRGVASIVLGACSCGMV